MKPPPSTYARAAVPLYWRSPNIPSQPSLLWELGHFFYTMLPLTLPDPAHTLALSECRCHILHKIMSGEPLSPSSPLHSDLALTSAVTGVLGPAAAPWLGRRREAAATMAQAALPHQAPSPCPHHLSPVGRQPSWAGPLLQLPGHHGHHGRDMLLFLILFFYEKNQCQSTDPLRNPAGRAQPAAPLPRLRGSVVGATLGQASGPSPPKGSPHLNVQPTPAV